MPDVVTRDPDEVFARLREIIAREFDLEEAVVRPGATFEDLDMDSIDAVDLAVSVEEELGFEFEMDDMAELRTVQDVVDLIAGTRQRSPG